MAYIRASKCDRRSIPQVTCIRKPHPQFVLSNKKTFPEEITKALEDNLSSEMKELGYL